MSVDLIGKKVSVYWNLHKKCFSVQHKGKVVAHVDNITLRRVEFRVSEAGRQRVLATLCKNVHAKVWGIVEDFENRSECIHPLFIYNPYKYNSFMCVNGGELESVKSADVVVLIGGNKPIIGTPNF